MQVLSFSLPGNSAYLAKLQDKIAEIERQANEKIDSQNESAFIQMVPEEVRQYIYKFLGVHERNKVSLASKSEKKIIEGINDNTDTLLQKTRKFLKFKMEKELIVRSMVELEEIGVSCPLDHKEAIDEKLMEELTKVFEEFAGFRNTLYLYDLFGGKKAYDKLPTLDIGQIDVDTEWGVDHPRVRGYAMKGIDSFGRSFFIFTARKSISARYHAIICYQRYSNHNIPWVCRDLAIHNKDVPFTDLIHINPLFGFHVNRKTHIFFKTLFRQNYVPYEKNDEHTVFLNL